MMSLVYLGPYVSTTIVYLIRREYTVLAILALMHSPSLLPLAWTKA